MVTNLNLGDYYYTYDNDNDIVGFLFIAQQGQFIIRTSEYFGYEGHIINQLHDMCEKTQEDYGVEMFIHYANKCFMTIEEAERNAGE